MQNLSDIKIAVIGLGYVGLPISVEFSRKYPVLGYDINKKRIDQLQENFDSTLEVTSDILKESKNLTITNNPDDLKDANIFIVTVPTPINDNKTPDLTPLKKASALVGENISAGNIIIFESTVYPGATEEVCVPIIEKHSKLKFNLDFYVGYSPERINPGDKINTLTTIKKITSGSTPKAADFIDSLYDSIIKAGTYKSSSIKVAEAAKVIENTQRDLNIAVINEFAKIFNKLGIDTEEVLDAAGTKWNFLRFKPGLVGGHCIGVDPYYLTYKALEVGYRPEVILAGRRINDGMGEYVATQLVKKMSKKKIHIDQAKVLIMGFTFKGDCPDVRNTKIIEIYNELRDFNMRIDVYDSWASPKEVQQEHSVDLISKLDNHKYDAVVIAVDHSEFKKMGIDNIRLLCKKDHVIYDVKHIFKPTDCDIRL